MLDIEKREAWNECFTHATRMTGGINLPAVVLTIGMVMEELLDKYLKLAQDRADQQGWEEK